MVRRTEDEGRDFEGGGEREERTGWIGGGQRYRVRVCVGWTVSDVYPWQAGIQGYALAGATRGAGQYACE